MFQLGAALLDACVLSVLSGSDAYGYMLTQNIKEVADISESTLYPVLRRLQRDDLLTVYDEPFNGRNRRYYRLTNAGRHKLGLFRDEWKRYRARLDGLILGGEDNEPD